MALKGHGTKFGRKMEAAVGALLTQPNIDMAAKTVGISPTALLSWMKVPEFDAAYREARRAVYSQSIARLQQAMPLAVQTMVALRKPVQALASHHEEKVRAVSPPAEFP